MAFESAQFDANIAAASGGDPALLAELRAAFGESLRAQCDLLRRARCDANWVMAGQRLKGLGASFHADDLVLLAMEALEGAPGDPVVLRKLDAFAQEVVVTR